MQTRRSRVGLARSAEVIARREATLDLAPRLGSDALSPRPAAAPSHATTPSRPPHEGAHLSAASHTFASTSLLVRSQAQPQVQQHRVASPATPPARNQGAATGQPVRAAAGSLFCQPRLGPWGIVTRRTRPAAPRSPLQNPPTAPARPRSAPFPSVPTKHPPDTPYTNMRASLLALPALFLAASGKLETLFGGWQGRRSWAGRPRLAAGWGQRCAMVLRVRVVGLREEVVGGLELEVRLAGWAAGALPYRQLARRRCA